MEKFGPVGINTYCYKSNRISIYHKSEECTLEEKKSLWVCLHNGQMVLCRNKYISLHKHRNKYKIVKNEQNTPEEKINFIGGPLWPRPTDIMF